MLTITVEGPQGSGKDTVAKLIHEKLRRARQLGQKVPEYRLKLRQTA